METVIPSSNLTRLRMVSAISTASPKTPEPVTSIQASSRPKGSMRSCILHRSPAPCGKSAGTADSAAARSPGRDTSAWPAKVLPRSLPGSFGQLILSQDDSMPRLHIAAHCHGQMPDLWMVQALNAGWHSSCSYRYARWRVPYLSPLSRLYDHLFDNTSHKKWVSHWWDSKFRADYDRLKSKTTDGEAYVRQIFY